MFNPGPEKHIRYWRHKDVRGALKRRWFDGKFDFFGSEHVWTPCDGVNEKFYIEIDHDEARGIALRFGGCSPEQALRLVPAPTSEHCDARPTDVQLSAPAPAYRYYICSERIYSNSQYRTDGKEFWSRHKDAEWHKNFGIMISHGSHMYEITEAEANGNGRPVEQTIGKGSGVEAKDRVPVARYFKPKERIIVGLKRFFGNKWYVLSADATWLRISPRSDPADGWVEIDHVEAIGRVVWMLNCTAKEALRLVPVPDCEKPVFTQPVKPKLECENRFFVPAKLGAATPFVVPALWIRSEKECAVLSSFAEHWLQSSYDYKSLCVPDITELTFDGAIQYMCEHKFKCIHLPKNYIPHSGESGPVETAPSATPQPKGELVDTRNAVVKDAPQTDPAMEAFVQGRAAVARNCQYPGYLDAMHSISVRNKAAEEKAKARPEYAMTGADQVLSESRKSANDRIRAHFAQIGASAKMIAEDVAFLDQKGWPNCRTNERAAFFDLVRALDAWKKKWNW